MGYSCTAIAGMAAEAIEELLTTAGPVLYNGQASQNTWAVNGETYFYERGREQRDGSVTGTVHQMVPKLPGDGPDTFRSSYAGGVKVTADGKILRFPTSTKAQRTAAELLATARYERTYGPHVVDALAKRHALLNGSK